MLDGCPSGRLSVVGSGLRRHFPLLPSLRDGLVTCRRVDLVTCRHAALARLSADSELAEQ